MQGFQFFIQELKGINERQCPAKQKRQCAPKQKRQCTIHYSLPRRENALCLCSSLKGTSTGPVKPQLFNMVALQEQLYMGQESILHSTQELAGPRMPSVFVCIKPVPQAVYRLCTKAATQLESLQEANHAVFTSVLGCSSFRSIKTRPLSPSTVNE